MQSQEKQPRDERVDLIDAENCTLGQTTRQIVRTHNLLHRGVGILCRNFAGKIYVHRRTTTKDVFPGLYDMFVGGVVGAGEDYLTAARREIAEELGIDGAEPRHLFDHLYIGPHNCSWVAVYEAVWNGPIRHQESEVAWGTYMTSRELRDRLDEWEFVPDGLEIFERYAEESAEDRNHE